MIQIARDLGYEVVERDLARAELYLADEVFLTGTAAELVPVREIDDHAIGTGKPGEITRAVQTAFDDALHGRDRALPRVARSRAGAHSPRPMIELYDATLRDGMQGEGMSLTAAEKLRVAHALDALGIHLIEAGFPASNPKEIELFELLARERFETAQIAAFGMTRRRDLPRRTPIRRCGSWPTASRPSARSSARRGGCTWRRSSASTARRTSR